jgi:hypothetical protein
MNRSSDSVLCASLLVLDAKKTLNIRDSLGDTAAHLAVKRNNIEVLRVLVFADGIKLDSTDKAGRSCRRIAAELQHTAVLEVIDAASRLRRGVKEKQATGLESQVPNTARIMQVWEKFFENAFKAMMAEHEAEDGLMLEPGGFSAVEAMYKTPSSNRLAPISPSPSSSSSRRKKGTVAYAVEEWFSWYVFYSSGAMGDRSEGYYALHAQTGEIVPLQYHLQKQLKFVSIFYMTYWSRHVC